MVSERRSSKLRFLVSRALSIMLTTWASCAYAEDVPDSYSLEAPAYYYNKALKTCPSVGNSICLQKLLRREDQELDEIYRGRFSYLRDTDRIGLKTAQQAWVASREKNCSWLGRGGATEIYYHCMLEAAISRRYWLLRNIGD